MDLNACKLTSKAQTKETVCLLTDSMSENVYCLSELHQNEYCQVPESC